MKINWKFHSNQINEYIEIEDLINYLGWLDDYRNYSYDKIDDDFKFRNLADINKTAFQNSFDTSKFLDTYAVAYMHTISN